MRKLMLVLFLLLVSAALVLAGGGNQQSSAAAGPKVYDFFLGYEKDNYPTAGTIFGNWLEEQTGVRIRWEILVGDLDQKVGIMAASGDYPDAVAARNATNVLHEAGAFIPLNNLLAQHGQDILTMWGKGAELLKQEDGEIYWFPQTMPYGINPQDFRSTQEAHGLYVQAAVLKEFGYPRPANLEEALDLLVQYAKKYPTIDGHKTFAFTALNDGWREYALLNAPHVFSGHPNDGKANVDWVNGKWTASPIGFDEATYKVYKLYNNVYLEGLYDPESFVMSYDQYIAKLTTGSILGFYDQWWNFIQPQELLKNQGQNRWYVPLPVVMSGYTEAFEGPLEPQTTEGLGITVNADDPVGIIQYLNFLSKEDTLKMRFWGREGIDYLVDADGVFYRNDEMIARFQDTTWRNTTYGADYWVNFLYPNSANFLSDGKNNLGPENQPSVYQAGLRPQELEVLKAYDIGTFQEWFNSPDERRGLYFPAWTYEYPIGSQAAVTEQRIADIRRRFTPRLIQAPAGSYDQVWNEYMAAFNEIPKAEIDAMMALLQAEIDRRVAIAGGY